MLKKLTILIAILTLALTACSAQQNQTTQGGSQGSQPGASGNGKLNEMSELIIGTLKLDGTAQAVTSQQAADLMPLWQVYKELMTSDTSAQAEIDGLGKQIKDSMTAAQLKAISDMKLTPADMMTYMQQGRPAGSAQAGGTATDRNSNSNRPGGFAGGMPPGGMPPGGNPGGDFGGNPQPQASGTRTPNLAAGARGMDRVPSMLIDTLIQYLKKVSAS